MVMLLSTLKIITFFLQAVNGNLECRYGGMQEYPLKGVCKGNRAGPGLWLCICSFIVAYFLQERRTVDFFSDISNFLLTLVVLIFMEDTDTVSSRRIDLGRPLLTGRRLR